jgi:tetratricopeptide (TPR) repeat protein
MTFPELRVLATVLVVLVASLAGAQEAPVYEKPAAGRVVVRRNIEFHTEGTQRLAFDLYRPAGDAVVPVLVVANIGSLAYGTWPGYIALAEAFADAGLATVIYQAMPNKAAPHYDAMIARLKAQAAESRLDTDRVVLWSGSANVLAGLPLAMDRSRPNVRGVIAYYGHAPVAEIRTDLPVFVLRAGLDAPELNRDIDQLIARALAANAPWTIESHGSGYHAFDLLNHDDVSRELIARTIAFAKTVVRPEVIRAYAALAGDAAVGAAFARGEWDVAIEGYTRRVAAAPGDAEAHRRLGLSLYQRGRYADALAALERAWALGRRGPRDTGTPAARAASRAGNIERALHWLGVVLSTRFGPPLEELRTSADFAQVRQSPDFEILLTGIAAEQRVLAMMDEGRSAEAVTLVAGAREGRLAQESTVNAMAYRLLNAGKPADAVALFRVNVEKHQASANAWESLSEGYERAGRTADAVAAARRALDLLAGDATLSSDMREAVRRGAAARLERLAGKSAG